MKRRRLYYIGGGGSSWRDPRNWSRQSEGDPVRHLHADQHDVLVIGGKGPLDLRDMPNAGLELRRFEGKLRLPDGATLDFAPRSRWKFWRRQVRPSVPAMLLPAVATAGGWRRAVAKGIAQLALTDRGWLLTPLLSGGAVALVKNGTANSGGSPAFGQATTAENLLVCTVSALLGTSGGNFTCSNGTWTRAVQDVSRTNVQTAIFYKANCGAGETAPTFSYSGTPSTTQCVLWEFSGVLKVSPLDQTGHANAAGSAGIGAMPNVVCGSANFANGELIVTADAISFGSATTITSSDTYNQGATPTGNLNGDSISTRQHYRHAYGVTTAHSAASSNAPSDSNTGVGDIISGCIASFKVAINITQTASLPYEALTALAVTSPEPYETLKGIQATAAEPYESGAGIARSLAEPYEALRRIAASASLPFEALLALAVAKVLPYEALLGVRASGSLPYESLTGLSVAVADPYETVAGVAGQTVLPFESLSAVAAAVAALPFESLAGLTAAAGSPFEALAELAAVAELPVESLAGVAAVIVLPYETTTLVNVQAFAEIPYEAPGEVVFAVALSYEELMALAAANEIPYETLGYHLVLLGVTDGVIAAVVAADGRVAVIASTDGEKIARAAVEGSISATGDAGGKVVETASTDGSIHP